LKNLEVKTYGTQDGKSMEERRHPT